MEILKWVAAKKKPKFSGRALCLAARKGHLDLLQWAHKQGAKFGNISVEAVKGDQLNVLKWIAGTRTLFFLLLHVRCHAHLFSLLSETKCVKWDPSICRAIRFCSISTQVWFKAHGNPICGKKCEFAKEHHDIPWLKKFQAECKQVPSSQKPSKGLFSKMRHRHDDKK